MSNYQISNEDCHSLLSRIEDSSINTIITDAPYIISKESHFNIGGGWNDKSDPQRYKTPPKTDFGEWDKKPFDWDKLMSEFYRVLKPSGTLLIFYDIWKMQELKQCAEKNRFKQPRMCLWSKSNPVPVNSKVNYLSNAGEYFCTFVKNGKPTFHSEYDKGIYNFPICHGAERTPHPTQKPLALMEVLVLKHTNEKDIVLDCFMGSGTTGVACLKHNRNFVGCEIDTNFFNIAQERLKQQEEQNG